MNKQPIHSKKEIKRVARMIPLLLPIEGKGLCWRCNKQATNLVGAECLNCRASAHPIPVQPLKFLKFLDNCKS